jgi:formylmethanofuran dehydrogenase subunit E
MVRRLIVSACLAFLFVFSSGAYAGSYDGSEIIIDTDMGLDDVRAIFALLADSTSTVHGIVTIEGSSSLGKGTDNLIGLLEKLELGALPVFRGAKHPGAKPPPWRNTADALAGNPFPPPRHITALEADENLQALIASSKTPPCYLALGPLGNLAAMGPAAIGAIESIWIPAIVDNNNIEGWNLSFDPESAFDVLSTAENIIIVDVGQARNLDAQSLLESVGGTSVAARWIEELVSGAGGHLMIYDEIAALAAIRPGLVTVDPVRYRIARDDGNFGLGRDDEGPIRIARINDLAAAAHVLVTLWEQTAEIDHHDHDAAHQLEAIDEELYIKTFHGHLGPYLVLGYRMGRIALRELDSAGHFGLSVIVHSRLEPPASCLIDGVQLGSGCTLGKRNIETAETSGPAYAEFVSDRGERITIALRADVPRLVAEMIGESGVEDAGDRLFRMSEDSLFEIRRE